MRGDTIIEGRRRGARAARRPREGRRRLRRRHADARARGRAEVRRLVRRAARRRQREARRRSRPSERSSDARRPDLGARPDRLDRRRRGEVARLARRAAAHARARRRPAQPSRTGSPRTASTTSSCSGWAARASPRRCCGARSAPRRFTCSTRRTRTAIRALEERIDLEPDAVRRRRRSPARRSRRARTPTTSGRRPARARSGSRSPTPARRSRRSPGSAASAACSHGEPTIGGRYSALSPFGIVPAALLGIDVDGLLAAAEEMAERVPARRGQPGLRARPRVRHRLAGGPRQDLHRRDAGRLRPLGRAAHRRVDRQAGQGPRARAGRVRPTAPTARPPCPSTPTRTRSAASSSAGSSPSPSRRRTSRSTRSTSPTSRRRRTRRTRCSRRVRTRSSSRGLGRRAGRAGASRATTSAFRRSSAAVGRERRADRGPRRASFGRGPAASSRTGYGPRYLHSTGQLHKGGPNTGLFLQVVDDGGEELAIPGKPFGFRRLIRAQAAGDYESLKERGRRVARIHMEEKSDATRDGRPRPHGRRT